MCLCRQGIADGEPDFSFAKRSDGTLREMKGALGDLRMVSGEQNEQEVKQHIAKVCVRYVCAVQALLTVGQYVLSVA